MKKPDTPVIEFVERFARMIIDRDFAGAQHSLAPWLRQRVSPNELAATIDAATKEAVERFGESDACQPQAFELDWNSSRLESLREPDPGNPPRPIADEVTDGNFRNWICIQFQPDEDGAWDLGAFFDLWMIVVELDAQLAIGYYELLEPD